MSDQEIKKEDMDNPASQLAVGTSDATTFPFLKLPPEIRNMIYRYVVQFDEPILLPWWPMICRQRAQEHGVKIVDDTLKVARLCKQTYHEALPIYFEDNIFRFFNVTAMGIFLRGIGEERRKLIANIRFEYIGTKLNDAFALLQECTNLEKLQVDASAITLARARGARMDLCTAHGLKTLLKVRGCKEVIITYETLGDYDTRITQASIKKFANLLTTELRKERKEKKTRKPNGQGKKALAAAAKAAKIKEADSGN